MRFQPLSSLVPLIGVEPIRYHYHRILSPTRLPIPPQRQKHNKLYRNTEINASIFYRFSEITDNYLSFFQFSDFGNKKSFIKFIRANGQTSEIFADYGQHPKLIRFERYNFRTAERNDAFDQICIFLF